MMTTFSVLAELSFQQCQIIHVFMLLTIHEYCYIICVLDVR